MPETKGGPALKRIVLTGGGTAGHVTPHLALIPHLKEAGYDIHYVGTPNGIERTMMEKLDGITYHAVESGKLRRYLDLKNVTDFFKVLKGIRQATVLMKELKPDVVFSKGGFVSVPVVRGAAANHIPILCHESDLTPGLANKLSTRYAVKVACTFPECAGAMGEKGVYTGTPLRRELFEGRREEGLRLSSFSGEKPILLMTGGSLGAQAVNQALRQALPRLLGAFDVIHLTGKGNLDPSLEGTGGYRQFEFVTDEMPHLLKCADIVLSRAGANTLCELQALKKPMLLIPYPSSASRGDQILNAESYRSRGLAHVLDQADMTGDSLADAIGRLWDDREALAAALEKAPPADGTEAILRLIEEIRTKQS